MFDRDLTVRFEKHSGDGSGPCGCGAAMLDWEPAVIDSPATGYLTSHQESANREAIVIKLDRPEEYLEAAGVVKFAGEVRDVYHIPERVTWRSWAISLLDPKRSKYVDTVCGHTDADLLCVGDGEFKTMRLCAKCAKKLGLEPSSVTVTLTNRSADPEGQEAIEAMKRALSAPMDSSTWTTTLTTADVEQMRKDGRITNTMLGAEDEWHH